MALLPARNILDGTALPVTSQMKTALGSLRDYLAGLLGTDSTNTSAARIALGAATRGANSDITSLAGLTTPLSMAQGGTGMVNGFASSMGGSGYQKLPSGLILQWGSVLSSVAPNVQIFWSFPIAFPVGSSAVFAIHANDGTPAEKTMINMFSIDRFGAYYNLSASGPQLVRLFAIGY